MAIAISIFFVSVPVFFEAPLVRTLPLVSLLLTGLWFWAGYRLQQHPTWTFWGDLLQGFSWSWLAGSIYWGWFRWEPLLHLPMEAIGLPIALWALVRARNGATPSLDTAVNGAVDAAVSGAVGAVGAVKMAVDTAVVAPSHPPSRHVGYTFYLGSLLGTAITDFYCYCIDVIPHWRRIMAAPPAQVPLIFREAVAQVETPAGVTIAVICGVLLLTLGWISARSTTIQGWIFSGTLLGTLLVDCLFIAVARL